MFSLLIVRINSQYGLVIYTYREQADVNASPPQEKSRLTRKSTKRSKFGQNVDENWPKCDRKLAENWPRP